MLASGGSGTPASVGMTSSTSHDALHPSRSFALPSSHCSAPATKPSPQVTTSYPRSPKVCSSQALYSRRRSPRPTAGNMTASSPVKNDQWPMLLPSRNGFGANTGGKEPNAASAREPANSTSSLVTSSAEALISPPSRKSGCSVDPRTRKASNSEKRPRSPAFPSALAPSGPTTDKKPSACVTSCSSTVYRSYSTGEGPDVSVFQRKPKSTVTTPSSSLGSGSTPVVRCSKTRPP